MRAVIAQYFNTEEDAEKQVEKNIRAWRGKIAWYVICASNGYFVISETAARKCFSHIDFSFKDRKCKLKEVQPKLFGR